MSLSESIFKPSYNCWKVDEIKHGTVLVDSADFYRAVHSAFSKARKSIFILGWDIDSATKLLRGEEEKATDEPVVLIELLKKKAREHPQMQIYILIWDSSVAFVGEREFLPEYSWTNNTPENVHFRLDDTIPLWGSHHQKIVLVDDELVFTGGMDLARQRWDERQHAPADPRRHDSLGDYGPFHDVQIMMDGPIVKNFSELVRLRWRNAAGYEAVAPDFSQSIPLTSPVSLWPEQFSIRFKNFPAAIARTTPDLGPLLETQEIKHMYRDLISRAQKFIYIENQYFSCKEIARALNRALRKNPQLQVLLVSSYDPQGLFESEAMWANRIDFKRIVEKRVSSERVRFVSSGTSFQGQKIFKRIHSKVIIIDDQYCTIGSANITNRSMELDTECDVILEAQNATQARLIADIRHDLIAEHIGASVAEVENIFRQRNPLHAILNFPGAPYHLYEIDDRKFTRKKFQFMAARIADPKASEMQKALGLRNPGKVFILFSLAFIAIFVAVAWMIRTHLEWFTPESVQGFLLQARRSPWSFFIVLFLYVAGGFVLFPVTLMSLLTAAVFGSLWGPIYGMTGALASAALMYALGHWAGIKGTRRFLGDRVRSIDAKFKKAGVFGVTIIRLIPIAPYSLVNIAAGISSVRFFDFMAGTFLGFLPAFLVKGLVGDSLTQVFLNPKKETLVYLTLGLTLWMALTVGTYFLTKKWRHRESS